MNKSVFRVVRKARKLKKKVQKNKKEFFFKSEKVLKGFSISKKRGLGAGGEFLNFIKH